MEEFHVKNFIFSSSATVYGAPKYLPLDEKHQVLGDAITNPYGKSKYICEHILKDTSIAHPVGEQRSIEAEKKCLHSGLEYHFIEIF